ncbi:MULTISPECIES: hypothetical protein [Methylomicrobium]|uniref:Uncharacterized protein n=1 Tax=Methylomicrobium album BG8 TaxID=686340 RepID=H8GGE7_METAL|nr:MULTISPECIES: hypothetical protein [Methylomicrobium]EIC31227.1 hypothetical protein Metal_3579 [Methylomicrobium album BG8]
MGEVTELFLVMLVLAAGAFAPLGYFIYKFSQTQAKPFGETEPHGDSPSVINDFAEKIIGLIKGLVSGK